MDSLNIKTLKTEKAFILINKELVKEHINTKSKAILLEYKADLLTDEHNIYSALDLFTECYELNKLMNDLPSQIRLLNKISALYIQIDKFAEAINNLNIVEKLIDKINIHDSKFASSRYIANMAQMFFETGEIKKAKKYYHQSFFTAKQNKEWINLNNNYIDFASLQYNINMLDSAMFYCDKVLKFSTSNKKVPMIAKSLILRGDIYEKKNDFILAEKQYKKAISALNKIGSNTAFAYKKIGNFYKRVYLYDFAHKNLRIAVKKTSKLNNIGELQDLYHDLMENSILQKRSSRAYVYLKKYDSIYKIRTKNIQNQNIKYINERYNIQQAEIAFINDRNALLKKQRELVTQKKIAEKNKWIYFVIILLLILLFLSGFLYYRYNKLNIEKSNIQLKNTVLRLQMNPHFIFNSLTAIQNSVLKNDQLKSAELIAIFSKLIRQNLEFSNRKQISLDDEIDMLTNYLETQKFRFNNIFDFKIIVDKDVDKEETQIPPMLLQPFIENSIEHGLKHKEKGGLIKVNISKIENGINICIEDNGIGRETAKVHNKNDDDKNKIHAIKIFRERLKNRQKKEMDNFTISDIVDEKRKVIGTKVEFNLID